MFIKLWINALTSSNITLLWFYFSALLSILFYFILFFSLLVLQRCSHAYTHVAICTLGSKKKRKTLYCYLFSSSPEDAVI